jgi:hypothetical protein
MKTWLRAIAIVTVTIVLLLFVLGQHYVLSSAKLDHAIKTELPTETPKALVVEFIQARHPIAYDDLGTQLKARLQGRAENMVYRKDIVVTFDFSLDGKLLDFSTKEYLSFL